MSVVVLIALFVCLIPTTIGALLSAIGIAGMDRLVRFNVLAMSGRAVEAAGDVDTLLLDKTGTITLGNRQATEFLALPGVDEAELADAAQFASLSDETPEGRSIVVLAKEKYGLRGREMAPLDARFVPFSAQTRMSGIDVDGVSIRKGAVDSIIAYAEGGSSAPIWRNAVAGAQAALRAAPVSDAVRQTTLIAERISKEGGTPLAVAKDQRLLGVVHLKDIVKGGIRERFAELRRMGIRHDDCRHDGHYRPHLSARHDRARATDLSAPGQWQPDRERRQGDRLRADRPKFRVRQVFSPTPVGDNGARPQGSDQDDFRALCRRQFGRLEPRADKLGIGRPGQG